MKRFTMRLLAICSFMLISQLTHAQMTIIEYFDIKDAFKLDLKAPKNIKTIYTKGVLDVEYNPNKRILSVAYDPKQADIAVIIKNINSCVSEPILSVLDTKTKSK